MLITAVPGSHQHSDVGYILEYHDTHSPIPIVHNIMDSC